VTALKNRNLWIRSSLIFEGFHLLIQITSRSHACQCDVLCTICRPNIANMLSMNNKTSTAPNRWLVFKIIDKLVSVRGDCSVCIYCWNCYLSLIKGYFHNIRMVSSGYFHLPDVTPLHVYVCPKEGPRFSTSNVFIPQLRRRWEVIVRSVDIDGIFHNKG